MNFSNVFKYIVFIALLEKFKEIFFTHRNFLVSLMVRLFFHRFYFSDKVLGRTFSGVEFHCIQVYIHHNVSETLYKQSLLFTIYLHLIYKIKIKSYEKIYVEFNKKSLKIFPISLWTLFPPIHVYVISLKILAEKWSVPNISRFHSSITVLYS